MKQWWSQRAWWPRTMPGLVAGGCLLTAIPLLAALLWAGVALDRLSRRSDALVSEGLAVMHLSIDLRDQVNALERNCRQYIALREPALLDLIGERWRKAETTLQKLREYRVEENLSADFSSLQSQLETARTDWFARGDHANAVESLAALDPVNAAIISGGREAIDHKVEALHHSAQTANRIIFLATLALIPLTALLTVGISRAVARPLFDLNAAIKRLGHASYSHPVEIRFPLEMRQLAQQLDWLRKRLAQLEADKDRFLQHVSHELKTPLASLSEGANLLSEGTLGPLTRRQSEVTEILCEAAAELESSIGTLLAYAEWRSERQQLEAGWFDAGTLINEILSSHRLPMERRHLKSALQVQKGRLYGQRPRLRIALDNLVTNAIKHAPEASAIEVGAHTVGALCEFTVRDYGSGVPDQEKEMIFEPFVRGSAALRSGVRGTGVGLSIVKETALAHNGNVYVEDAGPGARFRIAWPCPQPDA